MGMRYRSVICAAVAAVLLAASPAYAAVKYSDFRMATPSVFVRYGDEWREVLSGGYSNQLVNFKAYPAHGWSYVTRYGDERGVWKLPGGGQFAYGEWQVYVTSSGTNTNASYNDGYSNGVVNQLATHGWTTVGVHNVCAGSCSLSDAEGAANYVSTHRTDWDAVRFYY
jgi:hypothetical protein